MTIKVKYYGLTTELTGVQEESLVFEGENVGEFNHMLLERYPTLSQTAYQLAVNAEIAAETLKLGENDEISVLPPFAGG